MGCVAKYLMEISNVYLDHDPWNSFKGPYVYKNYVDRRWGGGFTKWLREGGKGSHHLVYVDKFGLYRFEFSRNNEYISKV